MVIVIPLEGRPKVREEAASPGDAHRLESWIKSQPELLRLVRDALKLSVGRAA